MCVTFLIVLDQNVRNVTSMKVFYCLGEKKAYYLNIQPSFSKVMDKYPYQLSSLVKVHDITNY